MKVRIIVDRERDTLEVEESSRGYAWEELDFETLKTVMRRAVKKIEAAYETEQHEREWD